MTKTMQKRVHTKPDGRTLNLYGWQPHDLPVTEELEPVGPPTPQMRWNALRGEWVAYAAHRQNRTFKPPAEYCPLCTVNCFAPLLCHLQTQTVQRIGHAPHPWQD